ncbi:MAG: hypothetical protein U5R48_15470 [Gammaproteobacteria bacterium]|nr:hypothetical protein [Gammaproteobacteria bacterium]
MIETRLILVEGMSADARTRLAQRIAIQLGAEGVDHELCHAGSRGHPLRRPWAADDYAGPDAFMDTLVLQWENFATRAGTEDRVRVFDAALLDAPASLLRDDAVTTDDAERFAARLMATLEALAPVLLYVWDAESGDARLRDCGDGLFGRLQSHRGLLNASRASEDELLGDALGLLGMTARKVELDPDLAGRLAGRYAPAGSPVDSAPTTLLMTAEGPRVQGLPGTPESAPRRCCRPTTADCWWRAWISPCARPWLPPANSRGLLLETDDPGLPDLPPFLARIGD